MLWGSGAVRQKQLHGDLALNGALPASRDSQKP